MGAYSYCKHLSFDEIELFTVVCLPNKDEKFPTVIYRTPYVDNEELIPEDELCANKLGEFASWLDAGYAVVFQHCRGRGKSSGDCIPYIYEREDGLFLQSWIREQDFYNAFLSRSVNFMKGW